MAEFTGMLNSNRERNLLFDAMCHVLSILENPTIICDSSTTILFANFSYCKVAQSKPERKPYWKVFPKTDTMPDYIKRAIKLGKETKKNINFKGKTFIARAIPVTKIVPERTIYMIYFEDITRFLRLEKQVELDKSILAAAFFDAISALSEVVETRDPYTAGHQKRTASIAISIARQANIQDKNFLITLYLGALIHDVGKISVPIEYLTLPRKLKSFELETIKQHVNNGVRIIDKIHCPWDIRSIVAQHHERLDGSGYPLGLKEGEISELAKIVAVADVFESMSTNRPYRHAYEFDQVINYLTDNKEILFDNHYVDCLLACLKDKKDIFSLEYQSILEIEQ